MAKTKKKLEELSQIDGKVDKARPTTLDQIWGDTGLSKYKTMDLEVYDAGLREMNLSDLQAHAIKVGLLPHEQRSILCERLRREFKKHVNSFKTLEQTHGQDREISAESRRILAEGR